MAKTTLEERLEKIFDNVNGWLKFAEAKNATLLTLNAAAMFGLHRLYVLCKPIPDWLFYWLIAATAFLFVSLLICLSSFFARTKIPRFLISRSTNDSSTNLMFYGQLAELKGSEFVDLLRIASAYEEEACKYDNDVAEQIIINSKIARNKFALFNAALWTTTSAVVTPLGALLFYWMLCDETI